MFNAVSYATVLHDADYGSIFGANLAMGNSAQVLLNGQPAPLLYASANQINFQIPANFPVGTATLQVNNGSASAFPVYIQVDSPPGSAGRDAAGRRHRRDDPDHQSRRRGERGGEQRQRFDHRGFAECRVGDALGVPMAVQSVTAVSAGTYQIQFAVTQSFAGWTVPMVVSVDGSPSLAAPVMAR